MTTKRLPDSLKEANEFILSNITDDTYIPLFTKNGNTEVMKKIKANILNSGGGSATPSAQPDRVIIIDTTLEQNIEGKAYKNFAEAKDYINQHTNEYFQIELPAGEFNEQIIISNKYFVHGNKTILTATIDTEISIDAESPESFSSYGNSSCIDNCIIEGSYKISETSLTTIKIYPLDNCIIKSTTAIPDGIDSLIMLKAVNCEVRVTKPENVNNSHVYFNAYKSLIYDIFCAEAVMNECVIANVNVMGMLEATQCQFVNINYPALDSDSMPEAVVKSHNFDIYDSNIRGTRFKFEESVNGNHFYNTNGGIKVTMHGDSKAFELFFTNCNLNILNIIQDSTKDGGYFETLTLENSICSFNNVICDTLQVILYNSIFNLGSESAVNNISVDSFSTLSTDSSATILGNLYGCCDAKYDISEFTTISGTDYHPNRYMYSSDAGQTMHNTKEVGDTHIGIIREPQFVFNYPVSTTSYIWIPLS